MNEDVEHKGHLQTNRNVAQFVAEEGGEGTYVRGLMRR